MGENKTKRREPTRKEAFETSSSEAGDTWGWCFPCAQTLAAMAKICQQLDQVMHLMPALCLISCNLPTGRGSSSDGTVWEAGMAKIATMLWKTVTFVEGRTAKEMINPCFLLPAHPRGEWGETPTRWYSKKTFSALCTPRFLLRAVLPKHEGVAEMVVWVRYTMGTWKISGERVFSPLAKLFWENDVDL